MWRYMLLLGVCSCSLSHHCLSVKRLQEYILKSLKPLDDMGGAFPVHCREEAKTLNMSARSLLKPSYQEKDAVRIMKKSIKFIMDLLQKDLHSNTWNTRQLDEFKTLIFRLKKELQCFKIHKAHSREYKSTKDKTDARNLRRYFKNLAKYVKSKGSSICTHEILRNEMRVILQLLYEIDLI